MRSYILFSALDEERVQTFVLFLSTVVHVVENFKARYKDRLSFLIHY